MEELTGATCPQSKCDRALINLPGSRCGSASGVIEMLDVLSHHIGWSRLLFCPAVRQAIPPTGKGATKAFAPVGSDVRPVSKPSGVPREVAATGS